MATMIESNGELEKQADNFVEALVDAFLQHELLNEARDYVERGRNLQMLSSAGLLDTWVTRFECWFKTEGNPRDMDDAAAEIRLRGARNALRKSGARIARATSGADPARPEALLTSKDTSQNRRFY
jgi:hypothetical protein